MGHRLPHYKGDCASPHGHNVKVEFEVVTPFGTFLDFKDVDSRVEALLSPFDHAMVLDAADEFLPKVRESGFRYYVTSQSPTTEYLAHTFFTLLAATCKNERVVRVTVHETDKYSATVRRDHV